jgi:hypothetical protein
MPSSRIRSLNSAATRSSCTDDARQVGDAQTGLENKVTLIFGDPVKGVRALSGQGQHKGSDVIIYTSQANQEETDELKGQIEVCGRRSEIIEEAEINQLLAEYHWAKSKKHSQNLSLAACRKHHRLANQATSSTDLIHSHSDPMQARGTVTSAREADPKERCIPESVQASVERNWLPGPLPGARFTSVGRLTAYATYYYFPPTLVGTFHIKADVHSKGGKVGVRRLEPRTSRI